MRGWIVEWHTHSGAPITVGDTRITPRSRALIVRWPGGGLVWNRPTGVVVERGGRVQHLPILDVTRLVQWGLLALVAALGLALARGNRSGRARDG